MFLVYVAGPFRAKNGWEIKKNVLRAEELALEVWRLGMVAHCPHKNTENFQGVLPDDVWLTGDLEILHRCDAVLLVPGWELSEGTRIEIQEARKWGLPVCTSIEELKEKLVIV